MTIKRVVIDICEACLDGLGQECHTPECALFLHAVDLPIHKGMITVLDSWESEFQLATLPVVGRESTGQCPDMG